jgi:hypothetical protein
MPIHQPDGCKHNTQSTKTSGDFSRSQVTSFLGKLSHQDSEILVHKPALLLTQLLSQSIYRFLSQDAKASEA